MIEPFTIQIETGHDGVHELLIAGELDQATAPELELRLDEAVEAATSQVLINLTDCQFNDSTGLGLLVTARERVVAVDGRRFGICCPHDQVRKLLEITGVDQAVVLYQSRDDALAGMRG
jgi:anti-anti-sigma factor